MAATTELVYDPYDEAVARDPHAVYQRLRAEQPLYRSEARDFYALSRHDDIARAFVDRDTFISSHGTSLDIVQSGMELPPGTVLMEDPPTHPIHRKLLSAIEAR